MSPADLSKFQNKRILIIGDIILDEFVYATSDKNSAEYKDVPILHVQQKKQYLGGAANVALNVKKLKGIPYLVGTVGNDEASKEIFSLLEKDQLSNLYIFINHGQNTTRKSRIFLHHNSVLRIDEEDNGGYEKLVYDFLLKNVSDAIVNHKPHAIILQDYNKGVLNPFLITGILKLARENNLKICVDPKFENWDQYKEVDLFKPNKNELNFITEKIFPSTSDKHVWTMEEQARLLKEKIHFKNLLVTLGSEGNFIFDGEQSMFHIPFSTLENPDVCGAGDTVIALATLALVCGFSLEEIAQMANKAGHIVCQKENVQPISLEELED